MVSPLAIAVVGLVSTAALIWNFGGDKKNDSGNGESYGGIGDYADERIVIAIYSPAEGETVGLNGRNRAIKWKVYGPKDRIKKYSLIVAPASELAKGTQIKDIDPYETRDAPCSLIVFKIPYAFDKNGYTAMVLGLGENDKLLAQSQRVHFSVEEKENGESNGGNNGGLQDDLDIIIAIHAPKEGDTLYYNKGKNYGIKWDTFDPFKRIKKFALIVASESDLADGTQLKDIKPYGDCDAPCPLIVYGKPYSHATIGYTALVLGLGDDGRQVAQSQPVRFSVALKEQ